MGLSAPQFCAQSCLGARRSGGPKGGARRSGGPKGAAPQRGGSVKLPGTKPPRESSRERKTAKELLRQKKKKKPTSNTSQKTKRTFGAFQVTICTVTTLHPAVNFYTPQESSLPLHLSMDEAD